MADAEREELVEAALKAADEIGIRQSIAIDGMLILRLKNGKLVIINDI